MQTITITAEAIDNSQIEAIKEALKALKIKFSLTKSKDKPYKEQFVEKILKSVDDKNKGLGRKITMEELNSAWK